MPKICYERWKPTQESIRMVAQAIRVCEAYDRAGFKLTLRQLYYQCVARNLFPADRKYWWDDRRKKWVHDPSDPRATNNAEPNYDWLGRILTKARMAGLIDWDHLEDRTRNLEKLAQWSGPESAMDAIAAQFRMRLWEQQSWYVECWVEKEALADVVSRPADRWFVPYMPCRGYMSLSEMWSASQRFLAQERLGKKALIIHLGDHDPSGVDMTRDIQDRLWTFGSDVQVRRIALSMDQVEQYDPPPNPAKLTDSRANTYVDQYGYESWELDALDPPVIDALIEDEILAHLDRDQWDADHAEMERERAVLTAISENWREVAAHARDSGWVQQDPGED